MHSEEEEKKTTLVKRSVGRPPKNRVIESSSGSDAKTPVVLGLRSKRDDEDLGQSNEIVI